jgi:hypothetical protein
MEVHRRVLTNQEVSYGKQMRGPINQFTHLRDCPVSATNMRRMVLF